MDLLVASGYPQALHPSIPGSFGSILSTSYDVQQILELDMRESPHRSSHSQVIIEEWSCAALP